MPRVGTYGAPDTPRDPLRSRINGRSFFAGFASAVVLAACLATSAGGGAASADPGPIAFAAAGGPHVTPGPPADITYGTTISNIGGAWNGTKFTAPVEGTYFFSVEFVNDDYYAGGTQKDVYVRLKVEPAPRARARSRRGSARTRDNAGPERFRPCFAFPRAQPFGRNRTPSPSSSAGGSNA